MDGSDAIAVAEAALADGRWADARAAYAAAVAAQETPAALAGLGAALWWLGDARESVRRRERAFVLFRRAGDAEAAGMTAVDLVIAYLFNLGNAAAARGWMARGRRAVASAPRSHAQGWLLLMGAFFASDADGARAAAEEALEVGRALGALDLELVALADLGLFLVSAGEVAEGMALLDEAMAATMGGECDRPEVVVYNCCSMLAACHAAGDLERAEQWCRVADEFMRERSSPFLFARCRAHFGGLLVRKGDWERAESELRAALGLADQAGPGPRAEALAGLATLRIRQGRLEEARELLAGAGDARGTAEALAELALAGGEPAVAVAAVERRLAGREHGPADATRLLALLVEARFAAGDREGAAGAARRLHEVAAAGDREGEPHARRSWADGLLAAAAGDAREAEDLLGDAAEGFGRLGLPFDRGRAQLALARVAREPSVAAGHARGALRGAQEIGATALASETAALLRALGVPAGAARGGAHALTRREREVLDLVAAGLSNPQIAERLFISRKTAAHHVSSILRKLGLRTRAELAAHAARGRTG